MNRTFKDYALLTLKGIGMGAADVVPGVSGGTIAFIVGMFSPRNKPTKLSLQEQNS